MAKYYIDAINGNDANDGLTDTTAFQTIDYALANFTGTSTAASIFMLMTDVEQTIAFSAIKYVSLYSYDGTQKEFHVNIQSGTGSTALATYGHAFNINFKNSSYALSSTSSYIFKIYIISGHIYNCNFINNRASNTSNTETVQLQSCNVKNSNFYKINDRLDVVYLLGSSFNNCNFRDVRFKITGGSGGYPVYSRCSFVDSQDYSSSAYLFNPAQTDDSNSRSIISLEQCSIILNSTTPHLFNLIDSVKEYQSFLVDNCVIEGFDNNELIPLSGDWDEKVSLTNNVLYNCSTHTPIYNIDVENITTTLVSNFISVDPLNADFIKLTETSPAVGYYNNLDAGKLQSNYGGGATDYPVVSDVRSGTSYNFGASVGTLDLPLESNVRDGITYDNTTKTGTLDLPLEADVKIDIQYDNLTKTGTYTGADRFNSPLESDVRNGVSYTDNTVIKTGTLDINSEANLPSVSDVRETITYGENSEFTGTLDLPIISDVRDGVIYDNLTKTGTLNINSEANLPNVSDVRSGSLYGENNEFTGTLDLPNISDVREGTNYDNATKTGTLNINSEANLPNISDVREGSVYGENNDFTGTLDLPLESDVRDGITYDNTTKIGSLDINTEANLPSIANVRDGITFGESSEFTGTLDLPLETNVRDGVSYDNATKTGTLDINTEANLPTEAQVLNGVIYGENNDFTGTHIEADQPLESDVRSGVVYDSGNKTGNVVIPSENDVRSGVTYDSSNSRIGTLATSGDYPLESQVLDGIVYDSGSKIGTLGKVNTNNLDIATQFNNNIKQLIAQNLTDFEEMLYAIDVTKNDFYNNANKYAVITKEDSSTNQIIGRETIDITFTIKLTTDFINQDSDLESREASLLLINKMELLRRKIMATRAGNYGNGVRNIIDWNRLEPEFLDSSNVVLLEASFTINYRV